MSAPSASVSLQPLHDGRAVEVHVSGKLSRGDYDRIIPHIEELLRRTPKLGFLVVLENFHGWEPGAVWADAKFDFVHRHQFGRIAVMGDAAWERWGTWLSSPLLPWEVRYFERPELAAARQWVAGEGGSAEAVT